MTASADFLGLLVKQLADAPSPQDLADVLVPEVADLVQIFLREGEFLHLAAYKHLDPEYHAVLKELALVHRPAIDHPTDPVAMVVRTRQAAMSTWVRRQDVERATPDTRVHAMFDVIQPRNIVVVPLERDGDAYGAIVAAIAGSSRRFMEGDLEFMRAFARRVGPLVQR